MTKEKRTVEPYYECINCQKDLLVQVGLSFYKLTLVFEIDSHKELSAVLDKYCVRLLKNCVEDGKNG